MIKKIWNYMLLLMLTLVTGCEIDADIDIKPERKVILYAFVEAGNECVVHAYQSISYTGAAGKMPLGEGARLYLIVDGTDMYNTTLRGTEVSVKFDSLDINAGSSIEVGIERENELTVHAKSIVPAEPSVFSLGSDEFERNGKKYARYTIYLANEQGEKENGYYQLIARDKATGEVIEDVEYLDRVFDESMTSVLSTDKSRGLFVLNGQTTRFMYLHCNVPLDGLKGGVELEMRRLTYEYYCYLQSVATHEAYMLLPVFGQNGLYTNVVNGIGLVTGVGRQVIGN